MFMPMIIGEIRRYLRDNSALRVSRSLRDTAYKALQAKEAFVREHQREPDIIELSKALDMPKEEVVLALDAILDPVSLFEPVFHDGTDTVCVMDQVGDNKNTDEQWLASIALREAIDSLSEREKRIIRLRFFEDMKLEEIALADDYFIDRKLYPNVDFYTGLIYRAMGFPTDFFTVLFAMGRLPGWIAHYLEQVNDPTAKINRPRQIYTGSAERKL